MPSSLDCDFDDAPMAAPSRVESFGAAVPARTHEIEPARTIHSPNSTQEAEDYLLSSILIDAAEYYPRAVAAGVTPNTFYDRIRATVFRIIGEMLAAGNPVDGPTLFVELQDRKLLKQLGGYPLLLELSRDGATIGQFPLWLKKVRDAAILRDLIATSRRRIEAAENYTNGSDISEFVSEYAAEISRTIKEVVPRGVVSPITNFSYPSGDDPNVLLGTDDYLGRGGGFLFVSHAGAGKSSWIMDACMSWALGRPWMGIRSNGPLKSLIIQAEDSDRYVGKVQASFVHANKLSNADQIQLGENCKMIRLKGVSGPAFFAELKRLTDLHAPDVVVLNPLYIYAEGDIGRSEFAQPFLVSLDAVNREEKFAYILVHHTGKPAPKGTNGKRATVEDWESVYMGFGSSYLANWPRCSALLEPLPGASGRYVVKLGKGGYNAGITRRVPQGAGFRDEPVTRIPIRHSQEKLLINGVARPVYHWEPDPDEAPSDADDDETNRTGRPPKHQFSTYTQIFPRKGEKALPKPQLYKFAAEVKEISESSFRGLLSSAVEDGMLLRFKDPHLGFTYTLGI